MEIINRFKHLVNQRKRREIKVIFENNEIILVSNNLNFAELSAAIHIIARTIAKVRKTDVMTVYDAQKYTYTEFEKELVSVSLNVKK